MKILLDTLTFLWFIGGDQKLSVFARQLIEDPDHECLLSIASLWEMAIKARRARLRLDLSFPELVAQHVDGNAMRILHLAPEHLDVLASLPLHHWDPFDRLIIAQAHVESALIVSRDEVFDDYAVQRLWRNRL